MQTSVGSDLAEALAPVNTNPTVKVATILNAASLSDAIDLGFYRLARIEMPGAWTAADFTVQVSSDGSNFSNLYDATGAEYTIRAAASRAILVSLADFLGVRFIRLRSGTSAAAVPQGADRAINLVLVA